MKLKNKVDNLSTQAVNRFDSNLKKEKATRFSSWLRCVYVIVDDGYGTINQKLSV